MKKLRTIFSMACVLFILETSLFASSAYLIEAASEKLSYSFFEKILRPEKVGDAYALAQTEDFELGDGVLFTNEMLQNLQHDPLHEDVGNGSHEVLSVLQSELASKQGEEKIELLQLWRYTFLDRLMTFMQEKASRKALFRLTLTSKTEYNSNVNRVNDDQSITILTADPDGKDDYQQVSVLNFQYYPLINKKSFKKNNKLEQHFQLMNIHQMAHESNEVYIFDTETKYVRLLRGVYLDNAALYYRVQNFGLSGTKGSRNVKSSSYSHRVKGELNFNPKEISWGAFNKTTARVRLSYLKKTQFSDTAASQAKNADDWRIDWRQRLEYEGQSLTGKLTPSLEYRSYNTKSSASGDYSYISFKLNHETKHDVSFLKKKLAFLQKFNYRLKDWDTTVNATPESEDFMTFALEANTKVRDDLKLSLAAKQAWRGRDMYQTAGKNKANQTTVTLGLTWNAP